MQNPFSDFKTNEMPIEKIQKLFTQPKYIERIYTPNAALITGQRGSGKTMFMRYIEHNPKMNGEFPEYIGIYYRFDRLIYGSKAFNSMDYDLFLHHLIIALLKQLVNRISILCKTNKKELSDFSSFAKVVCSVFYDYSTVCHSFEELSQFLESQRSKTMFYVRNSRRADAPTICDYSSCFQNIIEQLHKEKWLSNITVLFLLDEYENLTPKQRQAVNGLIKACSYGFTFKVFHRPAKIDTQVLDSDEHLMVQHDIMVVDFFEEIIGGDKYYNDFMKRIVQRRLQLYYESKGIKYSDNDLEISNYLCTCSINDEFSFIEKKKKAVHKIVSSIDKILGDDNDLIGSYKKTVSNDIFTLKLFECMLAKKLANAKSINNRHLIAKEVLSHFQKQTKTFQSWQENYKLAILYLLCFENQTKKQTAGWNQILHISKGIARHAINILYYTFENGLATEANVFRAFTPEEQTTAVYTVAEKMYDDIIRVPVVGRSEQALIQYFARVFQICHQDTTIKKWEVNHFVISKHSEEDRGLTAAKEVDNILDAAVTWGHLLKTKATKAKTKKEFQADLSEYQFHPLLSVYFGISWRKKQRYETTYEELYAAAFEQEQRRKNIYKVASKVLGTQNHKLIDNIVDQQSLFDLNSDINFIGTE